MKKCSKCQESKQFTEFYTHTRYGRSGYQSWCKKCNSVRMKTQRHRQYHRSYMMHYRKHGRKTKILTEDEKRIRRHKQRVKSLYGITWEKYELLLKKQSLLCAICMKKEKLHIDHDHKTKKVRGLLCSSCNIAIGHMREDVNIPINAIKYLK